MNLIDLNLVASLLLAITSLGTFSFLHINGGSPHHKSFTLFWGALCVLLTLNFFMMRCGIKNPAASLTLDVFANASLFLAAHSLFKGEAFSWRDKTFMISAVASVALSMLILLLGTIWRGDSLVWNLFYNSPSALFAAVAFVFIAIAVFRDPALTAIRWPLTILFGLYAFLQIPAYICFFAEVPSLQAELNEARDTIALFIAAGKFSLWFGFVTAIVVQCSDMHGATRVTNAAKWTMSLLSLGLLAVILIHRATQVKAINAEKPVEITVSLAEKIDPALPSMQASLRWD